MAHILNKPYTDIERADFIVEWNHNKGLNIAETEEAIYALEHNEIMKDGKPIVDPDYDTKQEQARKERILALTCTKREFALALKELGISYSTLKSLIESNEDAQLEWDLASILLRANPLIDQFAEVLGVTSEQIDNIFLVANGQEPNS